MPQGYSLVTLTDFIMLLKIVKIKKRGNKFGSKLRLVTYHVRKH